jgi:hypothetical protein
VRSQDGQAAADYTAVLLVVAAVLAVTGAIAVPRIGARVVESLRTGICIVGGDICRDTDAAAAGLPPCVTRERAEGTETALDVAFLHVGEDDRWSLAIRSDGSAVVTRTEGRQLGATASIGPPAMAPFQLEVGASGKAGISRRSARSWSFRDLTGARRFLQEVLGPDPGAIDRHPPDERWQAFGEFAEASVGVAAGRTVGRRAGGAAPGREGLAIAGSAGARIGGEGALGRRTGGGRTTWFFEAALDEPRAFATLPAWSSSGPSRTALVELTTDRAGARELLVRTISARPDRREEVTARLDLRDPEITAALGAALPAPLGDAAPWPPAVIRRVAELAATRGTVERQVHTVDDRSRTFSVSARFVAALGLEHTRVDVRSRLADATVWIAGSGPRRRVDCLGS